MNLLIHALYNYAMNSWHIAEGWLDKEEYTDYRRCCMFQERQRDELKQMQGEKENELLEKWIKNMEQIQDVDCRLCFIRGLTIGLSLQSLTAGEK